MKKLTLSKIRTKFVFSRMQVDTRRGPGQTGSLTTIETTISM